MTQAPTLSAPHVKATGIVKKAFGNLLQVQFKGSIRQGEISMVHLDGVQLKAEVIEINGDMAKIQVFEDTKGNEPLGSEDSGEDSVRTGNSPKDSPLHNLPGLENIGSATPSQSVLENANLE